MLWRGDSFSFWVNFRVSLDVVSLLRLHCRGSINSAPRKYYPCWMQGAVTSLFPSTWTLHVLPQYCHSRLKIFKKWYLGAESESLLRMLL